MSLVTRPFAQISALDDIARRDKHNLAQVERTISMVAGGLLALAAVSSRPRPRIFFGLLGGMLLYRGVSGHCELYQRLGINTARPCGERGVAGNKGINLEAVEHVKRSPEELYRYWRRLENLPTFLPNIVSVEETADGISHWKVKGPLDTEWEWDAEIIEEQPERMLSWRTLPGAAVANAGSVWFEHDSDGTRVKVSLQYQPPAGAAGAAIAKVLGADPEKRVQENLARFKELMESEV